jgi:drug/metabolite transporter (DMT)-like permease
VRPSRKTCRRKRNQIRCITDFPWCPIRYHGPLSKPINATMFKQEETFQSGRSAYLLLSLSTLFWAGNAIVGRALHAEIPPVAFAFWRWAVASLLLVPVTWRLVRKDWPQIVNAWPIIVVLAVLGISCFNTMLYQAAHTTTATNIALIQTAMPAAIVVLSLLLFGERVSRKGILGVALSMTGAGVVVTHGNLGALVTWHFVSGDLWMLAAVIIYALYSVLLRKRPRVHPMTFLTVTFVTGSAILLPLYAWELAERAPLIVNAEVISGILYVALFPSIAAYLCWNRGVELIGANRAGLFICLVPVFASALAVVFLGETLHVYHAIGLVLIGGGFLLFHHK